MNKMSRPSAFKAKKTAPGRPIVTVLFLIIFLATFSVQASAGPISTVDELNAPYNSNACITCHKDTHKGWKRSLHGKSMIDPHVLKTFKTFILNGLDRSEGSRKDLKDICLPCHAPQTNSASDDLIREIAGMIITAVEEIDPDKTVPIISLSESAEDVMIIDLKNLDEFETEYALSKPELSLLHSLWVRDKPDDDITFTLLEEPDLPPIIEIVPDEAEDQIEVEVIIEDNDTAPELIEDFTVSFIEDGEIPYELVDNEPVEVEDLTATLVLDNGKVKIEYSPYDPAIDLKEPTFLDKGLTRGDIAMEELSKLNINCMICHSMKALPGGNPRPGTIYGTSGAGSAEHKESLGLETRKSGFMKSSEFCAQCHHGCPPGMPSSICPTIWTSYKEDYMARGGDKTCQECHMDGTDKKGHGFPGIYEAEQVKKGIILTLEAEPTRYVRHLQNRVVPAVVMNVKVKNNAGHGIPNGCTYIPKTTMEVSVRDQNGNELFFKEKTYSVYNLHLPHNREGYLGLNEWDITAMNRINLGIDPGDTDSNTFVAPLNEETTSVVIEAVFKYHYEEGISAVVQKEIKNIEFEIDKKSPRM